jgi:prephenate dehydratase
MKKIAFQGLIGANSNLACKKFYPDFQMQSYATFYDVFQAVINNDVNYGMIPLENSCAGRVAEIHNLLQESNVAIIAEHFFKISHNLVAIKSSNIDKINKVYSHPQALMQCQKNINLLKLEPIEFSNTATAAEFISFQNNPSMSAICSKEAAENNNLKIIKENFQDNNDNTTIFIVISKEEIETNPKIAKVLTTLLFTIRNIPGSLYKALGGFATNSVSMIKLESYIPGGISQQAKFFITIEGHPSEKNVALALEELGFFSKTVKLLGVYYADKNRYSNISTH